MNSDLPSIGSQVGPYRLEALLGEGGFGGVFRATTGATTCALKILRGGTEGVTAAHIKRFLREAEAIASCRHPGIVRVLDAGHDGQGWVYTALELVEGEELAEWIYRQGRQSAATVFDLGAEIAEAVAAAHACGVVHRDIKPENVLVVPGSPRVKLLDFGIAKLMLPDAGATILTKTGQAMGTPMYMAPEQFANAKGVDERSDVYSIGAVLFEMLSRRTPFDAASVPAMVVQVCREGPPKLKSIRRDLDEEACAIVHRAMAMDPDHRFPSAGALVGVLRAYPSAPSAERAARSPVDPFAETTMEGDA